MKSLYFLMFLIAAVARGAEVALTLTAQLPASAPVLTPIAVTCTVTNTGAAPLTLEDFPRERIVRIEVLNAQDRQLVHRGFASPGGPPEGERNLVPTQLVAGGRTNFSFVIANRWSESRELLGPLFVQGGVYLVRFTYPVACISAGERKFVEMKTEEQRLTIRPLDAASDAAMAKLTQVKHTAWTLEPTAGLALASDAEIVAWESELRSALGAQPQSASAGSQRYALAEILFDRSNRPKAASAVQLRNEAASLAAAAAQVDFAYQKHAAKLGQQIKQAQRLRK